MWPWRMHDVFGNNQRSWFTKFERYGMGGFSMAAHQANRDMEDYSQVEVGDNSLFVGIYDGSGGKNAANFFSNVLLHKLLRRLHESKDVMSYDILRGAIIETKNLFKDYWNLDTSDSSCLITLVWKGILYVANSGYSRLVIGTEVGDTSVLKFEQLTTDESLKKLTTYSRIIRDDDRCIILASSGFWKIMNNEEAMLIVERHSKHGIARRLLEKALKKAAKGKVPVTEYEVLASSDDHTIRTQYHDDITVIVVFLNHGKSIWKRNIPKLSYKAPSTRREPLKSILAFGAIYP